MILLFPYSISYRQHMIIHLIFKLTPPDFPLRRTLYGYHFLSVFHKTHGLSLITGPNKTIIVAYAGSNETFTWKLKLSAEDKSKELKAQFGPWNKQHSLVHLYLITFIREPSGNETEIKANDPMAQRLFWLGDLARNDYVAFQLSNVQHQDAGNYGIRFRVDYFPPKELETWFSLQVEVKSCFHYNISFRNLACLRVDNENNHIFLYRNLPLKLKTNTRNFVPRASVNKLVTKLTEKPKLIGAIFRTTRQSTSFPGSSLYLEKVPWLRLVTCLILADSRDMIEGRGWKVEVEVEVCWGPSFCAYVVGMYRHVTSHNQGTFSR